MTERATPQGQVIPTPEWERVRAMLPGYSVVMIVDDEAEVREFLIVEPRADARDIDLDGRVLSAAEAKELLKDLEHRRVPPHLEQALRLRWANA